MKFLTNINRVFLAALTVGVMVGTGTIRPAMASGGAMQINPICDFTYDLATVNNYRDHHGAAGGGSNAPGSAVDFGVTGVSGIPYTSHFPSGNPYLMCANTNVKAAFNGTISRASDGCGSTMAVLTNAALDIEMWYIHLNISGAIPNGTQVSAGDIIGTAGSNGCAGGYVHNHIVMRRPSTGAYMSYNNQLYPNNPADWTFGSFGDTGFSWASNYDGDSKADYSYWRSNTKTFHWNSSVNGSDNAHAFGLDGDTPMGNSDYDGDGKDDLAIFRPSFTGFYYRSSISGQTVSHQFGSPGDRGIQGGDYDGDGKTDFVIQRKSTNQFFIRRSSNGQVDTVQFGLQGDIPVEGGDYDGDGKTDVAIFRPSYTGFYYRKSTNGQTVSFQFGSPTDLPIQGGDYDGDGKTDYVLFRKSTNEFIIKKSSNGQIEGIAFGLAGDIPLQGGDFDGDGKDDVAIYRRVNNGIYVRKSSNGATLKYWLQGQNDLVTVFRDDPQQNSTFIVPLDAVQNYSVVAAARVKNTMLGKTGDSLAYEYLQGDYNNDGYLDIYIISKMDTGSGKTAVRVYDGAPGTDRYLVEVATVLPMTGSDNGWAFGLGDFNRDGKLDVYAIDRNDAGSNSTAVHVLNGADGFQSYLLQHKTVLGKTGTDGVWVFKVGDYNGDKTPDIYAFYRNDPGSNSTAVHVLNGATNHETYLVQTGTWLPMTGSNFGWDFQVSDYNGDGKGDIFAVNKNHQASNSTRLYILNANSNFSTLFFEQSTTFGMQGNTNAVKFLR